MDTEWDVEWLMLWDLMNVSGREIRRRYYMEVVRKSIGAAVLISLGNYALLKMGSPIGPVIFAFGLLGVCYMGQNLFTGKCGFLFGDRMIGKDLVVMMVVNLVAGYLLGRMYGMMDVGVAEAAMEKVGAWEVSVPFFLKGVMCGVIMYIAVLMYRKGTPLGILFGVPLFIFCGFQHCVANAITMGAAGAFDVAAICALGLAVVGTFVGAVGMWWVSR